MADRPKRTDPYKNFNFRVAFGAALAGIAAVVTGKLLLRGRKKKPRKPPVEVESGSRPIEGVGTSIAAFVGTAPAKRRRASPAKRRASPAKRRPRKRS